jgi:hypothetical protein
MKSIYLDQLHWIEFSRAAHGLSTRHPETPSVLDILRQAHASGRACFPLSYAHYIETRKRRGSASLAARRRLATLMLALSGGRTLAPPSVVICHEIEMALARCFPGRVVPEPLALLGFGLAHTRADRTLEWPPGVSARADSMGGVFDDYFRAVAELNYLSGPLEMGPVTISL